MIENRLIYFSRTVSKSSSYWVALYYSNRVYIYCNEVLIQELLDYFDNNLENNFENNAWNLEHNAEKSQEILNRIMQRIMSIIITSALLSLL